MSSTSETGHAKNVANFDKLISFAIGYGTDYNPSKAAIQIISLQAVYGNANQVIGLVNESIPIYKNTIAVRELVFGPLKKLSTRIMSALDATDAAEQLQENARTINRKLQGSRAKPKKSEEYGQDGDEHGNISVSQMSFDSRLDNFIKLVKLLSSIAEYTPNEEDLNMTGLNALSDSLKTKNTAVVNATTAMSNARIARNKVLYASDTGLVDMASDVKSYVKSVYGTSSPQYKQVSKLRFKAMKL
jgi:hypothetical protein